MSSGGSTRLFGRSPARPSPPRIVQRICVAAIGRTPRRDGRREIATIRRTMSTKRASPLLPVLAVLGAMASIVYGTAYAKRLFDTVGAEGTTALRVGFAALILLAVWR